MYDYLNPAETDILRTLGRSGSRWWTIADLQLALPDLGQSAIRSGLRYLERRALAVDAGARGVGPKRWSITTLGERYLRDALRAAS